MLIHAQNMHISLLLLEVNEEILKLTTDPYCQPVAAGSDLCRLHIFSFHRL